MSVDVLLITGGRDFTDVALFFRTLDELYEVHGFGTIIHGGCPTGADAMVAQWVTRSIGTRIGHRPFGPIIVRVYPADWAKHGKAAGPIRNQELVDARPNICAAFPGHRGTADCVRRAKAAGVHVLEVQS